MNNIYTWIFIVIVSVIFGILDQISATDEKSKIRHILDIWRHAANYLITGILIYFLLAIRWPIISQNANIVTGDFIIGIAIMVGIFGWWPYIIKNLTEGIDTIISKLK